MPDAGQNGTETDSTAAARVLELTGVSELIPVYGSLDDAVMSVRRP
jgi:hypothetical protein